MLENVPAWLGKALKAVRPGHGKLTIARVGGEGVLGKGGFRLTSPAFSDGEPLDPCFTAHEEDAVAPPLEWTAPPPGTQELAIVVEDPDAPSPQPFCHWLVWGLSPQAGKLLEGEAPPRSGKNSFGNSEWLPPDPPAGHGAHDYVFQIFALDLPLALMPGAGRSELVEAMEGHVLAAGLLTGKYERNEDGDDFGEEWDESADLD